MMRLPLEDDFNDVLGKAQKGQGVSTEELAEMAGLSESDIRALRRGDYDEAAARACSDALGLNTPALVSLAEGSWYPDQPEPMAGFELLATPFHGMHVNAYVLWDKDSKRAIAFDTGTDASPMVELIEKEGLELDALLLTHTHGDHIAGVGTLVDRFGCQVLVNDHEPNKPKGAKAIGEGYAASFDGLTIGAIETTGHSAGGTSFLVSGMPVPLAIVGDALFAGSMGGPSVSYRQSLLGLNALLGLEPSTVLACGHGPCTSVAQERRMNCFYRGE